MAARTVYLVVEASWYFDDEFWHGDDVPVLAFSTKAAADADRAERARAVREATDGWDEDGPTYRVVKTTVED